MVIYDFKFLQNDFSENYNIGSTQKPEDLCIHRTEVVVHRSTFKSQTTSSQGILTFNCSMILSYKILFIFFKMFVQNTGQRSFELECKNEILIVNFVEQNTSDLRNKHHKRSWTENYT